MAAQPNAGPGGVAAPGANPPAVRHNSTQLYRAYEPPPHADVTRPWRLLVAALLGVAVMAIAAHRVCLPEVAGANERAAGVRHERRGAVWYHCEPWIRRALAG
jgi:hypothetical protein